MVESWVLASAVFAVLVVAVLEANRRSAALTWALFGVAPVLLLPWWIHHAPHSVFGWVKVYSVAGALVLLNGLRHTRLGERRWAFHAVHLFLLVNILEAVALGAASGGLWDLANAGTGVLLMLTLPGARTIRVLEDSAHQDVAYDIPRIWIVGYTVWNVALILLENHAHIGMHGAILGVALVIGLARPELWFQARAYTLGTFLLLFFTYKPGFIPLRPPGPGSESVAVAWVVVGLVSMVLHTAQRLFARRRRST